MSRPSPVEARARNDDETSCASLRRRRRRRRRRFHCASTRRVPLRRADRVSAPRSSPTFSPSLSRIHCRARCTQYTYAHITTRERARRRAAARVHKLSEPRRRHFRPRFLIRFPSAVTATANPRRLAAPLPRLHPRGRLIFFRHRRAKERKGERAAESLVKEVTKAQFRD